MSGWTRDAEKLRLALLRLSVVVMYRPLSHLWQAMKRGT